MKCIKYLVFLCLLLTTLSQAQVSVYGKVEHIVPDGVDTDGNITLTVSGSTAPYTYTWNPGAISTKDLSSITAGQYSVSVKSASSQTANCVYSLGYKVVWTNLNRCFARNDSVISNAANTNLYSVAVSKNTLPSGTDGWFEYVLDNVTNTTRYFFGFADSLSQYDPYGDLDYAFYYTTGKMIYYYESGVGTAVLKSAPKVGDVLRLERVGNTINYKINSTIVRTVTISGLSSKALKLKITFNGKPSQVVSPGCSFANLGSATIPGYVKVIPTIKHCSGVGISDGSIKAVPTIPFTNTYTWSPGTSTTQTTSSLSVGTSTLTVADSLLNNSSYKYNIGYKVLWTNTDRCFSRNDSLVSTSTLTSVYGTAISKNTLPANTDGWMEYVINEFGANSYYIGFTGDASSIQYRLADLDYAMFYIGTSKTLSYYETATTSILNYNVNIGDVIRIERVDSTITYRINGQSFRTVTVPGLKQKPLKIKAQMAGPNRIVNVGCSFYNKSNAVWNDYVQVYPLIKHNTDASTSDGSIKLTPKIPFTNTYNWTPGASTSSSISALVPGNYSVTVSDSLANQSTYNYNVGYKVKWTNLERCIFRNDSLTSTTNTVSVIANATSKNTLDANTDGWFEYVFDASATNQYYIGFTDSVMQLPYGTQDLDYAITCTGTSISYYEGGGTTTAVMSNHLRVGDIIRVERVGDVISYKINGYNYRSITVTGISQKVWKLKTNLLSIGRLVNVGCSFSKIDNTDFANYVQVKPRIIHTTSLGSNDGIINVTPKTPFSNTYTWLPGNSTSSTYSNVCTGTKTLTVLDSLNNKSRFKYNMGYKINWTGFSNTSVSNDTLRGSVTTNASAYSKDTLLPYEDGWIEYVYSEPTAKSFYFGFLDAVGSATVATDIDYGFYFNGTSVLNTYSGGTSTAWSYNFKLGDIFRVERFGDTIKYSFNHRVSRVVVSTGISAKAYMVKALLVNKAKLFNIGTSFTACRALTSAGLTQTITCSSPTVTLTGSISYTSGVTYSWTPGGSSPTSYTTQASTAGTYTLKMTYTNGCVYTPTVSVVQNTAVPTLTIESSAFTPTLGLNAYWPFTGNANDVSGNGNNGTVTSASLTADRFGNPNRAYEFNGSTSRIDVPNSATVDMPNGQDYSISFWMKAKSGNVDAIPISKNEYGGWSGYMFFGNSTDGGYCNTPGHGSFYVAAGGGGDACSDGIIYNDTTSWYFVTGQYNAATNQAFMYVNSVLQNDVGTASGLTSNTKPLSFGAYNDGPGIGYFKGFIDDIRMYNRMLTQSEINALYCEPNPLGSQSVSCTNPVVLKATTLDPAVTYSWNPGGSAPTSSITTINTGGSYTVVVTNTVTGCIITSTVAIGSKLCATATVTDYINPSAKGTVDLSVSGGVAPYNVAWNGLKLGTPDQVYHMLKDSLVGIDSVVFKNYINDLRQKTHYTGLEPSTYSVTVYDQANDSIVLSISVGQKIASTYSLSGASGGINDPITTIVLGGINYNYGTGAILTQTGAFSPGNHFVVLPTRHIDFASPNEISFVVPNSSDKACVGFFNDTLVCNGDTADLNRKTMFRFNGNGTFDVILLGNSIYSSAFLPGDQFSLRTNDLSGKITYYRNEMMLIQEDIAALNAASSNGFMAKIALESSGAVIGGIKVKFPKVILVPPPISICNFIAVLYPVTASASPNPVCVGGTTNLNGAITVLSGTPPTLSSGAYVWQPGSITGPTPSPVTISSAQTFSLNVTYGGCVLKKTVTVNISDLTANAGPDKVLITGDVEIGATPAASLGVPPYSYNWTPNLYFAGGTLITDANPHVAPTVSTLYTLVVTDYNGCTATDNVYVSNFVNSYSYANFKKKLDAGYYQVKGGKMYFTLEGQYNSSTNLKFKIYDNERNIKLDYSVTSTPALQVLTGDNRYVLTLSVLTFSSLDNGKFYTMEVINEKNELFLLKFKYAQ